MKISQEKVSLDFKEHLNDGNLWFLPFLFPKAFVASSFKPKNHEFNLIIFKNVFGVRWQGSECERKPL